jgi:hypothetical protein
VADASFRVCGRLFTRVVRRTDCHTLGTKHSAMATKDTKVMNKGFANSRSSTESPPSPRSTGVRISKTNLEKRLVKIPKGKSAVPPTLFTTLRLARSSRDSQRSVAVAMARTPPQQAGHADRSDARMGRCRRVFRQFVALENKISKG